LEAKVKVMLDVQLWRRVKRMVLMERRNIWIVDNIGWS
jgi:hypothetical protein